jgi:2-oxoglutarate dehydrogenase E2 component (dihydrolipoamide succinyltransferase)
MAQIEIRLPKMGESVTEATITNWLKNVGEKVNIDEPLVEVATDKVDNELPSEVEGILIKQLFDKDQVAQVGDVIAIISTDGDGGSVASEPAKEVNAPSAAESISKTIENVQETIAPANLDKNGPSGKFYSPLVRSIAEKENISMSELESIKGTGQDGRVTKKDILDYVNNRGSQPVVSTTTQAAPVTSQAPATTTAKPTQMGGNVVAGIKEPVINVNPNDEIIEMDRMRKMISDHMVMSVHVSAHVTSYVEADVTNIVKWREKVKDGFKKREGENITYTPIFMEAIAKAIKDFPMINVSVSGSNIIVRKDINLGMAAALPTGNLIVPVIKNADRLNLTGLTKEVNSLANRARQNKLKPEEIQGGTYTVTNVGTFGNVMGTPIINQPQVAILALGAIRKMPAVIETPDGDFIGIRHKMYLSHSYDHRVIDGALGGQFVRRVADYLEQFDINREL